LFFCVVLSCVITFWIFYCDVHYDFRIKTMFGGSSLSPAVWAGVLSYLCYLYLLANNGVQRKLCCVFFFFFVFVLCTLCCQFLCVVHFWLPLRHSPAFTLQGCRKSFRKAYTCIPIFAMILREEANLPLDVHQ